jgi:hypothetical protein
VEPKPFCWLKRYAGVKANSIGIPKYRQDSTPVELFRSHSFLGFFMQKNML